MHCLQCSSQQLTISRPQFLAKTISLDDEEDEGKAQGNEEDAVDETLIAVSKVSRWNFDCSKSMISESLSLTYAIECCPIPRLYMQRNCLMMNSVSNQTSQQQIVDLLLRPLKTTPHPYPPPLDCKLLRSDTQ